MSSLKRSRSPSPPPPAAVAPLASSSALAPCAGSPGRKRAQPASCRVAALQHLFTVPPAAITLVDRAPQEAELRDFVVSRATDGRGDALYVCGAPGTGKSATVFKVLRDLEEEWPVAGPCPAFTTLNAMTCPDPRGVYARILSSIGAAAGPVAPKDAEAALVKALTGGGRGKPRMHIVCIDEVDALDTAGQAVLYRLFQLPHAAKSSLILIGIANRINLPELLLSKLSGTRCSVRRLLFEPYTEAQLASIVSSRCGEGVCEAPPGDAAACGVFHPRALLLCGRKVSQRSAGDARKALDLAAVALGLAAREHTCAAGPVCWSGHLVSLTHMSAALAQVYRSSSADALAGYPVCVQVLIASLVALLHPVGPASLAAPTVTLAGLRTAHNARCKRHCVRVPTALEWTEAVERVVADGVVSVGSQKDAAKRTVSLNVDVCDVEAALGSRPFWA